MSDGRVDPREALERELGEPIQPDESRQLGALVERLERETPGPSAGLRPAIRERLRVGLADSPGPRPRRLRLLIAVYGSSGAVLLGLAALGAAGWGPLAL